MIAPVPTLRTTFELDGYVRLDALASAAELDEVRRLLDPLFAAPSPRAYRDLGGGRLDEAPRIPEVNSPSTLQPALRRTQVWSRCRALARELLDAPVGHVFDHAIYKPPHNRAPTQWHQDDAYAARPVPLRTVHFWIPLQDASVENGCMWYLPGSHRRGLVPHEERIPPGASRILVASPADAGLAVPCPVPAGGAVAHGPRTLHRSGPNESAATRRAWIIHFGAYGRLGVLHPRNVLARLRGIVRASPLVASS